MNLGWQIKYIEAQKKLKDLVESKQIPLDKIALSFSGGKDSCVMLKMIEDLGWKNLIHVVFGNTRMEFDATYRFIDKLRKDGWNIEETFPELPMPIIYRDYGKPFVSKVVSEMISRLQSINFDFKNDTYKSYEELVEKYNHQHTSALHWLTNPKRTTFGATDYVKKYLSEEIDFKISSKCCNFLKKKPIAKYIKDNSIVLSIVGVRKDESELRKKMYNSCIQIENTLTKYFPLLWFTEDEIWQCIDYFKIELSEAYTKYGCKRTGCVGCPFSPRWKEELEMLRKYEPNKAKACENMYKEVYDLQERRWATIVQIRKELKQKRKEQQNDKKMC